MPTFDGPAIGQQQPPQTSADDLTPGAGAIIGGAVFSAALYAFSRGRITPERLSGLRRFSARSTVGLGPFALSQVEGHDRPSQPLPEPLTIADLAATLNEQISPSGKYVKILSAEGLPPTRVPVELVPLLIERGLVQRVDKAGNKIGPINMMPLWNADP